MILLRPLLLCISCLILLAGFGGRLWADQEEPLPEIYSQVRIFCDSPQDARELLEAGMEFDHIHPGENRFVAVLSAKEVALLASLGKRFEVLVPDVEASYNARPQLSALQQRQLEAEMQQRFNISGFDFGSMGGYYTFSEVVARLDSMRLQYPNLISLRESIGLSGENRNIWMVKISDNPDSDEGEPEILYTALHHAREPQSMATVMYFMYYLLENYGSDPEVTFLVNNRELYFVPVVNPDGYVYNQQTNPNGGGQWRKNRRNNGDGTFGVDLNRNYGYRWGFDDSGSSPSPGSSTYRGPAAFSEPETQVIRDLVLQRDFKLCFNYHSYSNLLIYPWGYIADFYTPDSALFVDMATDMTQFNNYLAGTANQTVGYLVNGEANDWNYGEQSGRNKTFSFTPEVGSFSDNFWPPLSRIFPLAQENVYPNLVLARGPGVILSDIDDPNPPAAVAAFSDYTTPTAMVLSWEDPTTLYGGDPLPAGSFAIEIERDNLHIATVPGGTEIFADHGLTGGQFYTYNLYSRILATDSTSEVVGSGWIAGGSPIPAAPQQLSVAQNGSSQLKLRWLNPARNDDGTRMNDFAGIRLYENGQPLTTFTRSVADTGRVDSVLIATPAGTKRYYLTAIDHDNPQNESAAGNTAFSPLGIPFQDTFVADSLNGSYWDNSGAVVDNTASSPPTAPFSLRLNGSDGGDVVTLRPLDLSNAAGQGYLLVFSLQPQGTANAPEATDLFIVECLNNLGQWIEVFQQGGSAVQPFLQHTIALDSAPNGGGSLFHSAFRLRFRTLSTPAGEFDDWYVDDVFAGPGGFAAVMQVSPATIDESIITGETRSRQVMVSNLNALPSVLTFSVGEAPEVAWLSTSPASGAVSSNNSMVLNISLNATNLLPGNYSTSLIVSGDDPANPADTVSIAIQVGAAPVARLSADSLVTRLLINNQSDTLSFTVYNDGGTNLEVSIEDENAGRLLNAAHFRQPQRPLQRFSKGEDPPSRGTAIRGEGGPDAFGYTWRDSDEPNGPLYEFTDISGLVPPVTLQPTGTFSEKDEGMATLTLPFNVRFYGDEYNQVQVNSNGLLIFDLSFFENVFTNQGMPNSAAPNLYIAPFWDDLDGSAGGEIYAAQVGNRYIIQWHNWGHFPAGSENLRFQVVLFQGSSSIWLAYDNIVDEGSASFGIENADGTVGLEVAFNQIYAHNQLLSSISLGADWLAENPQSAAIAPGDSLQVEAIASAGGLAPGLYRANIVVNSNDPLAPERRVAVQMPVGGGALIAASADTVAFDSVRINERATRQLQIENNGSAVLQVNAILSGNPAFTVDTTQFAIDPGGMQQIAITFAPLDLIAYQTELRIISNDPLNDTLVIVLTGSGELPVGIDPGRLPTEFALGENYPNPFNPQTHIDYQVPHAAVLRLAVYNILGQRVRTLFDGEQQPGFYTILWDGHNDSGLPVGTGIYIYRLESRDFVETRKMVLMK